MAKPLTSQEIANILKNLGLSENVRIPTGTENLTESSTIVKGEVPYTDKNIEKIIKNTTEKINTLEKQPIIKGEELQAKIAEFRAQKKVPTTRFAQLNKAIMPANVVQAALQAKNIEEENPSEGSLLNKLRNAGKMFGLDEEDLPAEELTNEVFKKKFGYYPDQA